MSLVPYIAPTALRYAKYASRSSPYTRAATSLAKYAFQNRKSIFQAAKSLSNKRKRSSKTRPDLKPYPSSVRHDFTLSHFPGISAFSTLNSKQLFADRISMPAIGTGSTNRLTNQIYLKGIGICLKLQALKAFNKPVEIHFAVCQLGSDDTVGANWQNGFFRGDNASDNTISFENYGQNKNWDIRYLCNSLNPDNKQVLLHKKFMVDIWNTSTDATWPNGNPQGCSRTLITKDFYIPVKRVVKFNLAGSDIPEKPFIVFVWGLTCRPDDHDQVNQQSIVTFNYRTRLSYKQLLN